jgi:hypothetical protein
MNKIIRIERPFIVVVSGSNPTVFAALTNENAESSLRTTCITANSCSIEIVRTALLTLHGQIKNVIITWPTLINVNGFRTITSEVPPPKSPTT